MFSVHIAARAAFVLMLLLSLRAQTPATPPQVATDCTASEPQAEAPASKAKQAMSWIQRQAARVAAVKSGGATPPAATPPPASTPCPAPSSNDPSATNGNSQTSGEPPSLSSAPGTSATSGIGGASGPQSGNGTPTSHGGGISSTASTLFAGKANNNQFGQGQAGMGQGGGGYVEWDHNGRAANTEIPNVFVKEPGKAPAQAAYLGHEGSVPNVHYLRSTAESMTYKLVFAGNNFTLSRLSMTDEIAVSKLKLLGGSQQEQQESATNVTGAQDGSPIEISNGDGTQAVLTYTDHRGQKGTLNVHRAKPSSNTDGEWLNPDETVIFTVSGAAVTLSPAKHTAR